MNTDILVIIFIIWILLLIWFVWQMVCHGMCPREPIQIYQKGVTDSNDNPQNPLLHYICEPIFSDPSADFDMKSSVISVELIHTKASKEAPNKSQKVRLATLLVNFSDQRKCNPFSNDFRGMFDLIRNKPLPSITRIRAIHNSVKGSKIYLKGIEINDQQKGHRMFLSVRAVIKNQEMIKSSIHAVKPQKLRFWSRQTMAPDFQQLNYESYGREMKTPTNSVDDIHAVRLAPKLKWHETFVFNVFLIHLLFALIIGLLLPYDHYIEEQSMAAAVAVVVAGITAPTVAQLAAFIFRYSVKYYYDRKCSPMKVSLGQSSRMWSVIRALYLTTFFGTSIMLFAFIPYFIPVSFKLRILTPFDNIDNKVLSETIQLFGLLVLSLGVVLVIWLPMFVLIRFYFRMTSVKHHSKADQMDTEMGTIDDINESNAKPNTPRKVFTEPQSESIRSGEEIKYNSLKTSSVIVKPTKSSGAIDPREFALK